MATLKTQLTNPGARRDVGGKVLAAAKPVKVKSLKARLGAFTKAHLLYVKAADKVLAAEAVRDAAHAAVAEADVAQDGAVDALVHALVVAGAPRLRPFEGLSKLSPSNLKQLAAAKEAKELASLATKAATRPGATPALKKAAKAAGLAAAAVVKATKSVGPREKLYQETLATRDSLGQPWETALAYLKRAVRVAEDDGEKGLFATLFQRTAEAPKKKAAKPAAAKKDETAKEG